MSVLIKGMDMPTRCFACPMCEVENAEVNCAISHGSYIEYKDVVLEVAMRARPEWCPLIEVPPHGRLIDADKLHEATYHRAFETDNDTMWQSGCWVRYRAIEQVQDNQPTVIPADKDGET